MHRADRDLAYGGFDLVAQLDRNRARFLDRFSGAPQLTGGANEDADFMRRDTFGNAAGEPSSDRRRLFNRFGESLDGGLDPVEYRDRATAALAVAVHIAELGRQEPV